MFIIFPDCAYYVLVAPPILAIKLWLKNHIFTFLTSSLRSPADGTSYYALNLGHHNFKNYSETPATGILILAQF